MHFGRLHAVTTLFVGTAPLLKQHRRVCEGGDRHGGEMLFSRYIPLVLFFIFTEQNKHRIKQKHFLGMIQAYQDRTV